VRPGNQKVGTTPASSLIIWIHNLNRANAILESGQCTCSKLYPSWDGSEAEFEARFGDLPTGSPQPQEVLDLQEQSEAAWDKATALCRAQGIL